MSVMCERIRPRGRPLLAFAIALTIGLAGPAVAAETLVVNVDQSTLLRIPERTATLVIGNPLIADASLQPGGLMILTGKGYGATNLIALDRAGAVLLERVVQVEGVRDPVVFVYRGTLRETYSCTPDCERRVTLGDATRYFNDTLTQTTTLSDMAATHAKAGQDAQKDRDQDRDRDRERMWERMWDRTLGR
jgi:hypothetical protein